MSEHGWGDDPTEVYGRDEAAEAPPEERRAYTPWEMFKFHMANFGPMAIQAVLGWALLVAAVWLIALAFVYVGNH